MPATRIQSKRPPIVCPRKRDTFTDEEEEMTRMQRLQPWLMAGIALFGLSAAVIGVALNPRVSPAWFWPLQQVSVGLLVGGAILIVIGIFVVLLIPGLIWQFGARGKLYRTLRQKIKEGRQLELPKTSQDWQPQRNWAQAVMRILENDKGNWQPEIEELNRLDDMNFERPRHRLFTPNEVLAREIRSVEAFIAKLWRGEV